MKNYLLPIVLIALIAIGLGGGLISNLSGGKKPATVATPVAAKKVIKDETPDPLFEYAFSKPDPVWYFTKADIQSEDRNKVQISGNRVVAKLNAALDKYQTLLDVAKMHSQYKGKFVSSLFVLGPDGSDGASMFLMDANATTGQNMEGKTEVCLVAKEDADTPAMHGTDFFYKQKWGALVISAMNVPEPWFSAISIHELYHAEAHRLGKASAKAESGTDLYIEEEVRAHQLESKVLNAGTNGAYLRTIKTVLAKRDITSADDIIKKLTVSDMDTINKVFPESSNREMKLRLTQYFLDIGFMLIGDNLSEQIKWYRTMTGPIRLQNTA